MIALVCLEVKTYDLAPSNRAIVEASRAHATCVTFRQLGHALYKMLRRKRSCRFEELVRQSSRADASYSVKELVIGIGNKDLRDPEGGKV